MRDQQPPGVATWLAQRLVSGPKRESLLGDLIEQYRQGRSGIWYWRQVLAAILVGSVHDLAAHKMLAPENGHDNHCADRDSSSDSSTHLSSIALRIADDQDSHHRLAGSPRDAFSGQAAAVRPGRNRVRRNRFNRTAATEPLLKYLGPSENADEEMSRIFTSWNQLDGWLRQIERLRAVA